MNWKNRYIFGILFIVIIGSINGLLWSLIVLISQNMFPNYNSGNPNIIEKILTLGLLVAGFPSFLIVDILIWRMAINKYIGMEKIGSYTMTLILLIFVYMFLFPFFGIFFGHHQ